MDTVIDFAPHDHIDRHHLWDRVERADVFEQYLDLQTQGISQRQAATQLQVPRTTLQAWQAWHDTLDICPMWPGFFRAVRDWHSFIGWCERCTRLVEVGAREFWRFVLVQQYVGKLALTAIDYPPMQDPATCNLDAVKQKIDAMMREHRGQEVSRQQDGRRRGELHGRAGKLHYR